MVEPLMLELSDTGTSTMIAPIPVPADGTQTKHPDFAIQQDKEKLVPSQGNLLLIPPQEPRAQHGPRSAHWEPQHLLRPGPMTLSCPGGAPGPVGGGKRMEGAALRTGGHQGRPKWGSSRGGEAWGLVEGAGSLWE